MTGMIEKEGKGNICGFGLEGIYFFFLSFFFLKKKLLFLFCFFSEFSILGGFFFFQIDNHKHKMSGDFLALDINQVYTASI